MRMRRFFLAALVGLMVLVPLVAMADPAVPGNRVSNEVTGGFVVNALATYPVTLTLTEAPPTSLYIGQKFTMTLSCESLAVNEGGWSIGNALIVLTATIDGTPATGSNVSTMSIGETTNYPLGYDEVGGFFYWGPRDGFVLAPDYFESTQFEVEPLKTGSWAFTAWVVDLPDM